MNFPMFSNMNYVHIDIKFFELFATPSLFGSDQNNKPMMTILYFSPPPIIIILSIALYF